MKRKINKNMAKNNTYFVFKLVYSERTNEMNNKKHTLDKKLFLKKRKNCNLFFIINNNTKKYSKILFKNK